MTDTVTVTVSVLYFFESFNKLFEDVENQKSVVLLEDKSLYF